MSVIRVGDRVEHIDSFKAEIYYGIITEIWLVGDDGNFGYDHTRVMVLREVDDPTSWWACDPQDIRRVE